ncbi:glutamate-1-semialdehyde 2,1-aminomutase [candidate division KSB1 bacterium]
MSSRSSHHFGEAQKYLVGGVNSPVRAFRSVGGDPLFIKAANGSKIVDADDNKYIDYVGSWGPMILGHAHPRVIANISAIAQNGTSFGAPTELETKLANLIVDIVPSIEKVRMVNSGTEATMSAVRLARGSTGRDKIIKFDGCYHGHGDSFLIKAGSGALTLGIPGNPGVTEGTAKDTLVAQYNDLGSIEAIFSANKDTIAAVIVEPVAGNAGVIPPKDGFLQGLRDLCDTSGALLIFDEVMTGFRVALGGAQELYGVTPDLTTLGKIIGGGLPVGAYGGKADIMSKVAPEGDVYQAGTLSGNPLAMTAGLSTLAILQKGDPYAHLEKMGALLENGIRKCSETHGVPFQFNRVGSMMSLFFTETPVTDLDSAMQGDTELFGKYFHAMLGEGIYLAPSAFEAWFISMAHTDMDIKKTIDAHHSAMVKLGY